MFAYAYIHYRLFFGVYWIFTKLQNIMDIKLLNYYKYQLTIIINKFNL